MLPGTCRFDRLLLGQPLGPLVVSDHVGLTHRCRLVHNDVACSEAHGGDAGGVDHALDADFARNAEEFAGPVHIRLIHLGGIRNPQPVVGCHMDERITVGECGTECLRQAKIARDGVRVNAFKRCKKFPCNLVWNCNTTTILQFDLHAFSLASPARSGCSFPRRLSFPSTS